MQVESQILWFRCVERLRMMSNILRGEKCAKSQSIQEVTSRKQSCHWTQVKASSRCYGGVKAKGDDKKNEWKKHQHQQQQQEQQQQHSQFKNVETSANCGMLSTRNLHSFSKSGIN